MDEEEVWDLIKTSAVFNGIKVVGKYKYLDDCVKDTYINAAKLVCEPVRERYEIRMTSPKKMVLVDRNKYTPHQGKQEMERRR